MGEKFCSYCGAKLRANAKFCEHCGRKVTETTEQKSPANGPAPATAPETTETSTPPVEHQPAQPKKSKWRTNVLVLLVLVILFLAYGWNSGTFAKWNAEVDVHQAGLAPYVNTQVDKKRKAIVLILNKRGQEKLAKEYHDAATKYSIEQTVELANSTGDVSQRSAASFLIGPKWVVALCYKSTPLYIYRNARLLYNIQESSDFEYSELKESAEETGAEVGSSVGRAIARKLFEE